MCKCFESQNRDYSIEQKFGYQVQPSGLLAALKRALGLEMLGQDFKPSEFVPGVDPGPTFGVPGFGVGPSNPVVGDRGYYGVFPVKEQPVLSMPKPWE